MPVYNVSYVVNESSQRMLECSSSPRLDVELLLARVLKRSRTWLFAHGEYVLSAEDYREFSAYLERALLGEPVAYLLGDWAFCDLDLEVNPAVLIPRPETECLVEWVLQQFNSDSLRVLDLGTGSGAIALALAQARPQWRITAVDLSVEALAVAKRNAERNGVRSVSFMQSDWFSSLDDRCFDLIVSNPPYIADDDPHLPALKFEPLRALVAGADGLADVRVLLGQARQYLVPGGCFVVEHGYDQAQRVMDIAETAGFVLVKKHIDLSGVERFVSAVSSS